MGLPYEPVTIARTGEVLRGLVDPAERRIYLPLGTGVVAGDVAGFRGYTRRIVDTPEVWATAGVVATFEDAPPYLPDLGRLLRGAGPPVLNEETGDLELVDPVTLWSGACSVESRDSEGATPEIGDQQVGIVPFVVTVPLALIDVRRGDLFETTQSRDGRLSQRGLMVTAVRASSSALVREVLAFDNQGR